MGGVHIDRSSITPFISESDFERFELGLSFLSHEDIEPFLRKESFPLTPQGVLDLCKYGCWVYIPNSKIDSRSKADHVQKALVVLQVGWFALQCISRWAYSIPMTLLEVHTMVHVVCAITLYVFWFEVRIRTVDLT